MKFSWILLIIVHIFPSIFAQCTIKNAEKYYQRSIYDFSVDLVSRIAMDQDNHFVTSTLSAWTLLFQTSLGADDITLAEIKQVLHLHPHNCFNKKFFEITRNIVSNNTESVLEKSSSLFADESIHLKQTFIKKFKESCDNCDVHVLPFADVVTLAITINDYVNRATHGRFEDVVSSSDLEDVVLVLIDAIYFKGIWKTPFSSADTDVSAFYDEFGNQIGDVNLMFLASEFNIAWIDQIQATVLELPYRSVNKYSMLIFLPYTNVTMSTVIDSLKRVSLKSIYGSFEQISPPELVHVQLPRFKITSELINLRELLSDMGLKTMFDVQLARFPLISDDQLFVSNMIQKADIEVTEEGTTASAVSEAEFQGRSLPDQFVANKPFAYMIVERNVKVPLFIGVYSKPTIF